MAYKHPILSLLALVMAALLLCGCTVTVEKNLAETGTPSEEMTEEGEPSAEEKIQAELEAALAAQLTEEMDMAREPVQTSREPVGGEVTVSTVDELLGAIASDTTIILEPGTYDLSRASDYGTLYEGGWYTWGEAHDGWELVIQEVENLTITGTDASEVILSAVPRYADVIVFEDCAGITVENITAGHTIEPGVCMGGVLYLDDTADFAVRGSALYGCGILGIQAVDSKNILVEDTAIYECSYGAVQTEACTDVRVVNCSVYDCEGYGLFQFLNTYGAAVVNSEIYGNDCAALMSLDYSQEVYLLGTSVVENTFGSAMFASESSSPVVDGCVFSENQTSNWFGGSVFYEGGEAIQPVSPDGTPLSREELEAMTREEAVYDGPAAEEKVVLNETTGADGMREVTVTTVDELLAAIGPNTTVYLAAGDYNLSEASGYGAGGSDYYKWRNTYDGPELILSGLENFHLVGEGQDRTSILAEPRYADVLSYEDCENVSLTGITAGHTQAPSDCSGGVLLFENTDGVALSDCGLFGCGILGIIASDCTDILVTDTEIYDCTYGAGDIDDCENVVFENCDVHDCGGNNEFRVSGSTNVVYNGERLA